MNKDISIYMVIVIFLNIIHICNSQRSDSSPTSVPTSQPTDYTENIYFDADIILIVSLLLVSLKHYIVTKIYRLTYVNFIKTYS